MARPTFYRAHRALAATGLVLPPPSRRPPSKKRRTPQKDVATAGIVTLPPLPWRRTIRRVSIIVLNRDGADLLDAMLASLSKHCFTQRCDVIIVDHASRDHSEAVAARHARGPSRLKIRFVKCGENHSFSYSNNRAVEMASGDAVLLLNNDIEFTADVILPMMEALEAPDIGAVGLKQYLPADAGQKRAFHHIGIRFFWTMQDRILRPKNVDPTPRDKLLKAEPAEFLAVTGSILMMRRADYLAVGGLSEDYVYGFEDVDICLKVRNVLGKRVISLNTHSALHNESTTRKKEVRETRLAQRAANRAVLKRRFGYLLRRDLETIRLTDDGSLTGRPLQVCFALTSLSAPKNREAAAAVRGLARAMETRLGWTTKFLAKSKWPEVAGCDVYVVIEREFMDLRLLAREQPNMLFVAWIRDNPERWIGKRWFYLIDIVLAASEEIAETVRSRTRAHVETFPVATSHKSPGKQATPAPARDIDYAFSANYEQSQPSPDMAAFDPGRVRGTFVFYGTASDSPSVEKFRSAGRQSEQAGNIYEAARLIIDETADPTKRELGMLNGRVLQALSSGALVLTNNAVGADTTFRGLMPVWRDAVDLEAKLNHYLANETERAALARRLQEMVLFGHTFRSRAGEFRDLLARLAGRSLRIAIKCAVKSHEKSYTWGDYHFALSLRRALLDHGHLVRVDIRPEWYSPQSLADDVVIVLRGLHAYEPSPDQINLVWLISHPTAVPDAELEQFDHVFAASESYAARIARRLRVPVTPLLQCTDPDVFFPAPPEGENEVHQLLFVGNSRGERRWVPLACAEAGLPISVFGASWGPFLSDEFRRGTNVKNAELNRYYSNAAIVLNDHWPDMAATGIVSNRIFDAGLCGAFIITDRFADSERFGDMIVQCETSAELVAEVEHWLPRAEERRAVGERLRAYVAANHTFAHRAADIMAVVKRLHAMRMEPPHDAPLAPRLSAGGTAWGTVKRL